MVDVLDIPYDYAEPEKTVLEGIEAMEAFFRSIHMPTSLRELGIDPNEEEISELAYKCSFQETRTIGGIEKAGRKDMEEIYRMAK